MRYLHNHNHNIVIAAIFRDSIAMARLTMTSHINIQCYYQQAIALWKRINSHNHKLLRILSRYNGFFIWIWLVWRRANSWISQSAKNRNWAIKKRYSQGPKPASRYDYEYELNWKACDNYTRLVERFNLGSEVNVQISRQNANFWCSNANYYYYY